VAGRFWPPAPSMATNDDERAALAAALAFLQRRRLTEAELRARLADHGAAAVDAALERLRAWGYVKDEEVARGIVQRHRGARARGRRLVRQEALRRGVDPELFERVYAATVDEEVEARALFQRWSGSPERRAKRLLARGFPTSLVLRILREAGVEPEAFER
jgi:regulatory protein